MTETYERSWTHEGRPELNRGVPAVDGPWMSEPDKVHWIDPDTDFDCLIVRNGMGAWCGYVGLPPGHRFHGKSYSDCLDGCDESFCEHSPEMVVSVHGGLTFSSSCSEDERGEAYGICHVPLPGRPADVWWLGFDCAHYQDLTPFSKAMAASHGYAYPWAEDEHEIYRDVTYVRQETADLARQLAEVR